MKRWIVAGIGAAAMLLSLLFVLLPREPVMPMGENGTFANDCCGTVQLTDGKMLLNGSATVRYRVKRDSEGPYVLPRSYVGVREYEGFDVDGTRPALKLRLDRLPRPSRIMIYEGRASFAFTREAVQP